MYPKQLVWIIGKFLAPSQTFMTNLFLHDKFVNALHNRLFLNRETDGNEAVQGSLFFREIVEI